MRCFRYILGVTVGQNAEHHHPRENQGATSGGPVATEKGAVVWTCVEDANPSSPRGNLFDAEQVIGRDLAEHLFDG